MRTSVIEAAQRLSLSIDLVEVSELAQLAQVNPLSLPRLYIGGALLASKNPLLRKDGASFPRPITDRDKDIDINITK